MAARARFRMDIYQWVKLQSLGRSADLLTAWPSRGRWWWWFFFYYFFNLFFFFFFLRGSNKYLRVAIGVVI